MAGVNAQLRLVRRGCLRSTFRAVLQWLDTFANPALRVYGLHVDLAWFQATTDGYYHYGLLIYAVEEVDRVSLVCHDGEPGDEQHSRYSYYPTLKQTSINMKYLCLQSLYAFISHSHFHDSMHDLRNKMRRYKTCFSFSFSSYIFIKLGLFV